MSGVFDFKFEPFPGTGAEDSGVGGDQKSKRSAGTKSSLPIILKKPPPAPDSALDCNNAIVTSRVQTALQNEENIANITTTPVDDDDDWEADFVSANA